MKPYHPGVILPDLTGRWNATEGAEVLNRLIDAAQRDAQTTPLGIPFEVIVQIRAQLRVKRPPAGWASAPPWAPRPEREGPRRCA